MAKTTDKPASKVHKTAADCIKQTYADGTSPFRVGVTGSDNAVLWVSAAGLHDARLAALEHHGIVVRAMKQGEQLGALKEALGAKAQQ